MGRSLISYILASIGSLAIATTSLGEININPTEVTPTKTNTELPNSPNRLKISVSVPIRLN